ncbi:MAG TPA: SAM-dependent chlorinase/fluorinase [Pyrinomonadaceae bacterium]|nr:SAM-dependent chlorinase/fluorinase [Pyrinomonadaceae bacterium]
MFIALLTDFGTRDYYVGAMKGVILSINENANIIDISHEIEPQNIRSASFVLANCFQNFPAKTIFVAVVDPGVGSERKAILVETDKYYFIAPDNGLLSFVFENVENFRIFELTNREFFAENVSNTFHGRDIFAPVAAHLSLGISPEMFGNRVNNYKVIKQTKDFENAEIIHIDRFGNLVTNLRQENLPEKFAIEIGETLINKICRFYAEAEDDELIMILGSSGFLEISAKGSSAAEILSINRKTKLLVKPI